MQVNNFKHIPGKNDAEYIELLKDALERKKIIISKAIAKLKEQPEVIRCKDCRHWKDSDGVFRRGIDAESKCPLNLHKVYEGTFFCGMAERRTDD